MGQEPHVHRFKELRKEKKEEEEKKEKKKDRIANINSMRGSKPCAENRREEDLGKKDLDLTKEIDWKDLDLTKRNRLERP